MIGGSPRVGHVLRYNYDWSDPGQPETIEKERPAVIVLTILRDGERVIARVAPVTHRPPQDTDRALEIPPATKHRLGLDGERSWIMLDHFNEFVWPGPEIRPVPGRSPATIYYGPLPPAFFAQLRAKLLKLLKDRRIRGFWR